MTAVEFFVEEYMLILNPGYLNFVPDVIVICVACQTAFFVCTYRLKEIGVWRRTLKLRTRADCEW